MLNATFARVDESDLPRLREWLAALPSRSEELRESYARQGTRHELFFLIETQARPLLVLISELDDLAEGTRSFLESDSPLDLEFKTLVSDISTFESHIELLYDSSKVALDPPG